MVRPRQDATACTLLSAIDVVRPDLAAADLVGLVDALLLYRTADVAPIDAVSIVTAYIRGLARSSA
ncbi:hypothetical protein Csp2054_08245 [Curtobacterium sp. 'Ferrero']|nr:hypothetical protein Csp2054_08245 [Curtobacterium sp. 'Ferrero']